jgi:hypothetical protein
LLGDDDCGCREGEGCYEEEYYEVLWEHGDQCVDWWAGG